MQLVTFNFRNIELQEACWIDNRPYFTRSSIGEWLEYTDALNAVSKIISRNSHIKQFSRVVSLSTLEGDRKVTRDIEVYDPIGFQLIIFESRQPKAIRYKVDVAHLVEAYVSGKLRNPDEKTVGDMLYEQSNMFFDYLRVFQQKSIKNEARIEALEKFVFNDLRSFTIDIDSWLRPLELALKIENPLLPPPTKPHVPHFRNKITRYTEVCERAIELLNSGLSYNQVAETLNEEFNYFQCGSTTVMSFWLKYKSFANL
jgi:hypothetical protein